MPRSPTVRSRARALCAVFASTAARGLRLGDEIDDLGGRLTHICEGAFQEALHTAQKGSRRRRSAHSVW
jgi:hypothetical protein